MRFRPSWVELTFPLLSPSRAFRWGSNASISPLAEPPTGLRHIRGAFVEILTILNHEINKMASWRIQTGWCSPSECFRVCFLGLADSALGSWGAEVSCSFASAGRSAGICGFIPPLGPRQVTRRRNGLGSEVASARWSPDVLAGLRGEAQGFGESTPFSSSPSKNCSSCSRRARLPQSF